MTNITKIPQFALIDYTYTGLSEIINQLMLDRQLTAMDMEIILDKLMLDIQKKKMLEYATSTIENIAKIQKYEKEIKNEEVQSNTKTI